MAPVGEGVCVCLSLNTMRSFEAAQKGAFFDGRVRFSSQRSTNYAKDFSVICKNSFRSKC